MPPRNPPRYLVQLPVSFVWDRKANGTVHNLSVRGCLIQTESEVAEGEYFSLQMSLGRQQGQEEPVQIKLAAVRWSKGRAFGTEFLLLDPDEQQRLLRYLATCWQC
jgi:hypothetical protein